MTQTLDAMRARYLREQRATTKPTTYNEECRLWRSTILPGLGGSTTLAALVLEPADGTDGPIAAWYASLASRPYVANRAINSLSHAFKLAERLGWVPVGVNPCRGIRRYPERPRRRYAGDEELARLGSAIDDLLRAGRVTESSADAIRALQLTGCRRNEILRLAWRPDVPGALGWVDLDTGLLDYIDSKGGPKVIPLRDDALALFRRRAHNRAASPWVFPSPRDPQRPLAGLQRAWETACEAAGLRSLCIHSLRHSFATSLLERGVPDKLVMGLLGHRDRRSLDAYQHPTLEAMRRAVNSLAAFPVHA